MRLLLFFILVGLLSCKKQNFELNISSIERLLLKEYSLNDIENELNPNFKLVSKSNLEWKFRDDSKNWESVILVSFDSTTKLVKGVMFTAPDSRLIEYSDELQQKLGYVTYRKSNAMEEYSNSTKNLSVDIYKTINNIYGERIILYGVYRTSTDILINSELLGKWYTPHVASINIKFYKDHTFEFDDYNEVKDIDELLTGKFELNKGTLTLHYTDRPKEEFKFYKGEHGDARYYIKNSQHYFIKEEF